MSPFVRRPVERFPEDSKLRCRRQSAATETRCRLASVLEASPAASFLEPVRQLVEAACACAKELGHRSVGTEHLLLAISTQAASPSADALAEAGITAADLLREILRVVGRGEHPLVTSEITLTPRANRILTDPLSADEQRLADHVTVGHVLLRLAADTGCTAQRLMRHLGPDSQAARAVIAVGISEPSMPQAQTQLPIA